MGIEGSHRQYNHSFKKWLAAISGHLNDDIARGTFNSILKQAGSKSEIRRLNVPLLLRRRRAIIQHRGGDDSRWMKEAIEFHIEGLQEDGLSIPQRESSAEYIVLPVSV